MIARRALLAMLSLQDQRGGVLTITREGGIVVLDAVVTQQRAKVRVPHGHRARPRGGAARR